MAVKSGSQGDRHRDQRAVTSQWLALLPSSYGMVSLITLPSMAGVSMCQASWHTCWTRLFPSAFSSPWPHHVQALLATCLGIRGSMCPPRPLNGCSGCIECRKPYTSRMLTAAPKLSPAASMPPDTSPRNALVLKRFKVQLDLEPEA